jgi:single-stranded-DNA-specific exonuclease
MSANWISPSYDSKKIQQISNELKIQPLVAQLLTNRGISSVDEGYKYLFPKMSDLIDPLLLNDMEKAVSRIKKAISEKEQIMLYSDYDTDGISGSSILFNVMKQLGASLKTYTPNRNSEGYGVRIEQVKRAKENGIKVIITIDQGITAIEAAKFCTQNGIAIIIVDHHEFLRKNNEIVLPEAYALIHPRIPGSKYAEVWEKSYKSDNPNPCGTAVAFKLAWAVARSCNGDKPSLESQKTLLSSTGLVAMGSVADVVDLIGENRTMVKYGLKQLQTNPMPGIQALTEISKVEWPMDATQIGFKIAPRINAASRMGDAGRAFRLMTTEDQFEAFDLALELDRDNLRRREVQKVLTERAREQVTKIYGKYPEKYPLGLVIAMEDCPVGLVGIIASKLVDEHQRPVIVCGVDQGVIKGSGRTIHGASLLKCLQLCEEDLANYGGHAMACGVSIKPGRLDSFRESWAKAVEIAARSAEIGERNLHIDAYLDPNFVTFELVRQIDGLEPFGAGNRAPLLAATSLEFESLKLMGDKTAGHCSFVVKGEGKTMRAVSFSNMEFYSRLKATKSPIDIIYRPRVNSFRGNSSLQIEIIDLRTRD